MSYGYQLPTITKVNKYLVIALGSLFLINSILTKFSGISIQGLSSLSSNAFFSGHIYKLATYPLVAGGLLEALFDGLILWFIGSQFESMWGVRRYISFLATCSLGGGLFFILLGLLFSSSSLYYAPLSGMGGISGALCVAYGILFPNRVMYFFLFPMKAKYFVLILISINLYQGIFSPALGQVWGSLGAYGCGFLWLVSPRGGLAPLFRSSLRAGKKMAGSVTKKKTHLTLVNDENDSKSDDVTYH